MVDEIIEIIKKKFKNKCGIVYCLSRKDCDDTAARLMTVMTNEIVRIFLPVITIVLKAF